MTTRNLTCATTAGLSRAVRALAREHALDPAVRARLVLSAAEAAGAALRAGREAGLEWGYEPAGGLLTVVLRTPGDTGPVAADLPMAPDEVTEGETVWRLPASPPSGAAAEAPDEDALAAEELRAVVAAADALTSEHRRLNDELAGDRKSVV